MLAKEKLYPAVLNANTTGGTNPALSCLMRLQPVSWPSMLPGLRQSYKLDFNQSLFGTYVKK